MTAWALLAAGAGAVAVLLSRPPAAWLVADRLALQPRSRRARPRRWAVLPVVGAVVGILLVDATAMAIVGATLLGVGCFGWQQVRANRARVSRQRRREEACTALDLLAAELRGGILPGRAMAAAAMATESLHDVAEVVEVGGDLPAALRRAATRDGAGAWAELAAGWTVAERAGAPLADVVERIADTVRADLELVREVASEAAPARATGRLMATLPVLGLGLGAGLGADPIRLLTGTVPGALCLAAAASLACLGTWWVDRVVASAEIDS